MQPERRAYRNLVIFGGTDICDIRLALSKCYEGRSDVRIMIQVFKECLEVRGCNPQLVRYVDCWDIISGACGPC